jgi:hypothetical protein
MRTKALCCVGFSSGVQRTWNASIRVIFMVHAPSGQPSINTGTSEATSKCHGNVERA